jgi:hypothetical protein
MLHLCLCLFGENHRKILNICRIFHQKFKQVLQSIFIGLCFSPAVSGGFDDIEHPGGFEALVGYFLVDFFILESVHLDKIEEDFNKFRVFEGLNDCLC